MFANLRSAAAAGKPDRWQAVRVATERPPGRQQGAGQIRPSVIVRAGIIRQLLRRAREQRQIVGLARVGDRIRLSQDCAGRRQGVQKRRVTRLDDLAVSVVFQDDDDDVSESRNAWRATRGSRCCRTHYARIGRRRLGGRR